MAHLPLGSSLERMHAAQTGTPSPLIESCQGIAPELVAVLAQAHAKSPSDRYASACSFMHELRYLHAARMHLRAHSDELAERLNASRPPPLIVVGSADRLSRFEMPDRLYGREEAMAVMRDALMRTARGERTMVSIRGPSGMGKSALIDRVIREASPDFSVR